MNQQPIIRVKDGKKYFFRFTVNQRLQHILLAFTVITLVLTGMPLKFHHVTWAPFLYSNFGGIHLAPIIHRTAGVILLLLFAYHLGYLTVSFYAGEIVPLKKAGKLGVIPVVRAVLRQPMMPTKKDLIDLIALFKYLFFFSREKPRGSQFTWKEKFDYWAPFWGIVIIGSSGIIMWAQVAATKVFPGKIISFALIAHSDEALLAGLFLFIWHWYNVHFSTSVFPMGKVFLTGYLSEELMVEEHYDHYVEVMKREGFEDEILPPPEASLKASRKSASENRNKEGHQSP